MQSGCPPSTKHVLDFFFRAVWTDSLSVTLLGIFSTFTDGTMFWWKKILSILSRSFPPPEMTYLSLKPEVMVAQERETKILEDLAEQLTC